MEKYFLNMDYSYKSAFTKDIQLAQDGEEKTLERDEIYIGLNSIDNIARTLDDDKLTRLELLVFAKPDSEVVENWCKFVYDDSKGESKVRKVVKCIVSEASEARTGYAFVTYNGKKSSTYITIEQDGETAPSDKYEIVLTYQGSIEFIENIQEPSITFTWAVKKNEEENVSSDFTLDNNTGNLHYKLLCDDTDKTENVTVNNNSITILNTGILDNPCKLIIDYIRTDYTIESVNKTFKFTLNKTITFNIQVYGENAEEVSSTPPPDDNNMYIVNQPDLWRSFNNNYHINDISYQDDKWWYSWEPDPYNAQKVMGVWGGFENTSYRETLAISLDIVLKDGNRDNIEIDEDTLNNIKSQSTSIEEINYTGDALHIEFVPTPVIYRDSNSKKVWIKLFTTTFNLTFKQRPDTISIYVSEFGEYSTENNNGSWYSYMTNNNKDVHHYYISYDKIIQEIYNDISLDTDDEIYNDISLDTAVKIYNDISLDTAVQDNTINIAICSNNSNINKEIVSGLYKERYIKKPSFDRLPIAFIVKQCTY